MASKSAVIVAAIAIITLGLSVFVSHSAHAATTLPTKMNFQGRITNSAGNILTNGTYNMRFKIYDQQAPGGTSQWSEDRLVSAGQGVTVTNGQFSVQLGEITALPASVFTSNSRYFEIELPTPATATTSSPTWTELPMTPRNQLATSAYAYNTETLDGIDGSSFAQLSSSNVFTVVSSIDTSHANAFQVKNGATNLFNVDTSGSTVTVGASDTSATLFVLDTKSDAGDPSNVAGAMYYNSNLGKFRCYQGGWTDCISSPGASLSANNTWTGTNYFQNTTNSTNAFSINNQTSDSMFKVDTTNAGEVTILGNNAGENRSWQSETDLLPVQQYGPGSVVANGYVYSVGGYGSDQVYYAKLNADGSTGAWQTTTPLSSNRYFHNVVTANGYLYTMGGSDTLTQIAEVWSAKINSDGSLGAWRSLTSMPDTRYGASAVVSGGYVYVMGGYGGASPGFRDTVWYAKLNADGTVGTWQVNANALPATTYGGHSVVANGFVYMIAGSTTSGTYRTTVYYASINTNGSLATWQSAPNTLPLGRASGGAVVSNGYVYIIGGDNSTPIPTSTVYYTKLNRDGTVGAWSTSLNPLPDTRTGAGYVVANGYVYVINGTNGATQNTIYYSRLGGTLKVGGNLDLVGLQGQNLADGGDGSIGSTGGSITAGNITAVGNLQIQKQATFADAASVTGNFNAGNGIFNVDTVSSTVEIGGGVADSTGTVLVLDTKNTTGDPTGVVGAMYYNSSLERFRCYEATAWENCTHSQPVNGSTATQAVTAGTATYLTGSVVPIPSGGFEGPTGAAQDGTLITWKVYMSKTAAGTAASTVSLRVGTAGTTADATRCTNFSTGTATAVADWAEVTITAYATAGRAVTTLNCTGTLRHNQAVTGFSNAAGVRAASTAASFDSTPANTKAGLVFTAGTSAVITIQRVEVTTRNL